MGSGQLGIHLHLHLHLKLFMKQINKGLMLKMSAFETLYSGQLTLSTHWIKSNLSFYTPHRSSAIVSLETYPLFNANVVYHVIELSSNGLVLKRDFPIKSNQANTLFVHKAYQVLVPDHPR